MKKNPLISIFLVVFIDLLGFGIVVPILPYYATDFGASASELGWLMMCYSGMQFLFSPFWGSLSDRIGRRPVILICLLGMSLSMLFLGLAPVLSGLFVARLLSGFFGANISTAMAYIADVTKPSERAKGMGLIGAAFGLGFLFGPALGGLLSHWGYAAAPLFASGLSLINFIFTFFILKEPSLSVNLRSEHRPHPTRKLILQTLKNRPTGIPVLLFFVVTLGMAQLETTFGLFLLKRFQLDAIHAGLILALMALIMVFIQGRGIGPLVKNYGEVFLIIVGTGLMGLSLVGASYSNSIPLFVGILAFHAIGYALTNPSLSGLMSRSSSHQQGATMGIFQSAGSLGRVLGPISAGYLFDHLGIRAPFLLASFLFGTALLIVLTSLSSTNVTADAR